MFTAECIFCPDGITPNSGLTGPNNTHRHTHIYIYIMNFYTEICVFYCLRWGSFSYSFLPNLLGVCFLSFFLHAEYFDTDKGFNK